MIHSFFFGLRIPGLVFDVQVEGFGFRASVLRVRKKVLGRAGTRDALVRGGCRAEGPEIRGHGLRSSVKNFPSSPSTRQFSNQSSNNVSRRL